MCKKVYLGKQNNFTKVITLMKRIQLVNAKHIDSTMHVLGFHLLGHLVHYFDEVHEQVVGQQ